MDRERASDGVVWGVVAALAMSTLLLAATAVDVSPAPQPVYEVVVALVASNLLTHLVYGGVFGALVDRDGSTTGTTNW